MNDITDAQLMAYVDGELGVDDIARVERAIAEDPLLAGRVAAQRSLREQLRAAFDPVLDEPVPERLRTIVPTPIESARAKRRTPWPQRWTWRESSAVAASLVVGILAGPYVLRSSQPLPLVSEGGRIVAIGDLEQVLSTGLTGAKAQGRTGATIGLSFRTATGQYCRTFAAQRGPAGLACRERGDWVIEVLARNPRPRNGSAPDGYRQAGTPFPDAIRQALVARMSKEPLTQAEEAQAIKFRWRSESVLKEGSP